MILIVDDKSENIFSLQKTLELSGFQVDSAGSGEEALKKILKTDYSLIILDVQMPGMDGFEVAEVLSGYSKAKDIPIIFLSAVNTDKKFVAKGYKAGGIDYVTKPVDPDIFLLRVKTLHQLYEQKRELNRVRLSLLEEVEVRKKAEETLKKTMEAQQTILESLPQIAFTLKSDGGIEFVNEHWHLYADNGREMPEFHPLDIQVPQELKTAIAEGSPLQTEVRLKNRQNNNYRYHLLRLVPIKNGSNVSKWVGTFTDIQAQKDVNDLLELRVRERTEELLIKNNELERTNHELQQFASVASHDLKEPLRKIQMFSSLVSGRLTNDVNQDVQTAAYLERIKESSHRMSELINDLLDYSRLSIDGLFRPVSLKTLVEEVVADLDFTILDRGASVSLGNLPVAEVIPGQMRQVFQNLIINSLKFCRADIRPAISITADVDPAPGGEQRCSIFVADNGIGFDEQYLDRIFTIFQRLNPAAEYEGTGIGLAIVKKIIDKHGGTITARSTEGAGSTFVITLPLQHQREPILSPV